MNTWKASDAKRHFAEVIQEAASAPQLVLLRGEPVSVVVSYDSYSESQHIVGKKSIAQWLDDLPRLCENEGEMELPLRRDRADQFGDDWR